MRCFFCRECSSFVESNRQGELNWKTESGTAGSDNVEVNFSIISSAVSIALALVAIFNALKQDSDNQRVNASISNILSEISTNVRHVGETIKKLDIKEIDRATDEAVEQIKQKNEEKKKETYTQDEVNELLNDVKKQIKESVEKTKEEVDIWSIQRYFDNSNISPTYTDLQKLFGRVKILKNENQG